MPTSTRSSIFHPVPGARIKPISTHPSLSQNFPDLPSRVITEMIARSFQRRRSSLKSTRLSMINLRLKSDQSSTMKGGGRRKKRGRHAIEHRWGMKEEEEEEEEEEDTTGLVHSFVPIYTGEWLISPWTIFERVGQNNLGRESGQPVTRALRLLKVACTTDGPRSDGRADSTCRGFARFFPSG